MTQQIIKEPIQPTEPTKPDETKVYENEISSATLDDSFLNAELSPQIVSEYFTDSYDKDKHFIKITKREVYNYRDDDYVNVYYIVLYEKEIKPNKNFKKEMKTYENLKDKYDKDLAKYFEDLKSYQKIQIKIQELKSQIKELGGEIE